MSSVKQLEDLIRSVEIFEGLDTREINKVLQVASGRKFDKDAAIFHEGDQGDCFYLIIEGSVRIEKKLKTGETEEVATLKAGDYFGEMSLFDGEPRSATVISLESSKLLEVKNSQFIKIVMGDDAFARNVLWAFCSTFTKRLRDTNALLAEYVKK